MPTGSYKHKPGETVTCHASAPVTGRRAVAISGAPIGGNPQCAPAGAGVLVFAIALEDAASGAKFTAATVTGGGQVFMDAGAGATAGARAAADGTSRAIAGAAGNQSFGQFVNSPGAAGAEAIVALGFLGVT